MNVSFSINQHDNDGEVFDRCILLHVGDTVILRFNNFDELAEFGKGLDNVMEEIKKYYFDE